MEKNEIKELAREFTEFIKPELLGALKAQKTGNHMWAGEIVKAPIKTYYPGAYELKSVEKSD